MKWKDRSDDNKASRLELIDEFCSFVRPTWRPILSDFCKDLTDINQVCTRQVRLMEYTIHLRR